jgi:ectoine hydroxylase-related dioxygenase (phytanoyl-CoA dioxygenase family)
MEDVLRALGVNETLLDPRRVAALDDLGYVVFERLIDAERLEGLRRGLEAAPASGARGSDAMSGTRHYEGLIAADPVFELVYAHPVVLAAARHVLRGPLRVGQCTGREPLPGFGQQGLHADAPSRSLGRHALLTTIWMLDDFTPDNGATRVVPGTHRLPTGPPKRLADPGARHPEEVVVCAPAGSVLAFNGLLWHSGTRNRSGRGRRAIQCLFVGRDSRWFVAPPERVPENVSAAARWLVGPWPSS